MYHFVKRIFDIFSSIVGIIIFIPLYILIRLAYICTGDFHRIIYCQERVGLHGKPFKMLKFRSMIINAEDELQKLLKDKKYYDEYSKNHKLDKDPRITKVGKIIRHLSFDEFPQFFNVLIGQMSIVGNRPYITREKKDLGKNLEVITSTKPGITGYWQVHLRSRGNFNDRIRMDIFYSENASLTLDAKIFFSTFWTILSRSGAK